MSSYRTRRVTGDAVTGRLAWQGPAPDAGGVSYPLANGARSAAEGPMAVRDLSSLVAERQQAVEREAFAKGHAKGEAAGRAAAAAKADATMRRLTSTIDEIAALRSGLLKRTEQDIVKLAVAMAERIVQREISVDRDVVLSIARAAASRLGDQTVATIHLNPADFEAVKSRAAASAGRGTELVADPNVAPGGTIIRSALGSVDTSIDAQVREIARALLGDVADDRSDHASAASH